MSDSEYSRPTPPPAAPGAYPPAGSAPAPGAYPPPPAGYPQPAKTNTLAIVSFICSIAAFLVVPLIGSITGVITGHIALHQLKTSREEGRGFALAGTIIGWVGLGLTVLLVIVVIAWVAVIVDAVGTSGASFT